MSLKPGDIVIVSYSEHSWKGIEHQQWAFAKLCEVLDADWPMVRVAHTNGADEVTSFFYREDCLTKIGVL